MKLSTSADGIGGLLRSNTFKITAVIAAILTPVLIAALAIIFSAHAATMQIVRPADIRPISEVVTGPAGWYLETTGSGNAEITTDVPYGGDGGSVKFTVNDTSSYAELANYKQLPSGDRLADIGGMAYATWQQVDNTKAVSLQIGMDTDVTDPDVSWQGRMVYEPYRNTSFVVNEPVIDGKWQTWVTHEDDSVWWMTWSPSLQTKYGNNTCPQNDPCTYAEILADYPDIGFNAGFGNPLILKAGSGWSNFVGYVDFPSYTQTVATMDHMWNFEPTVVTPTGPTTKEDCFNNGWQAFGYKNQGACVNYVAKL